MTETIQLRQTNPDETDRMGDLEEPDNDVYGKLSREVADQLGEYIELTISEEAEVMAATIGDTKNYGKYETPAEAVVGLGVSRDVLDEITGEEVPDEIGLAFAESDEDSFEEVVEEVEASEEEEASALVGGDDESDDEEESDEEEVEIADEEVGLVESDD